jgi:NDP-sugar pyrophosphorylase family protein
VIPIKVVIMAGGKGTRLRPLTFLRPKPLIPLVNKPILDHILTRLDDLKFDDIILTLNYMSEKIKNHFKKSEFTNQNINYSVEKTPLGTAGSVKNVEKYLNDTFLVLSGDVISNIDFRNVLRFHKNKGALATVVLTKVEDPDHYGIANLNSEDEITNYLEKPSKEDIFSNLANTGTYILEPELFEYFKDFKDEIDFSNDVFPKLIEENLGIYGYVFDGYWNDVGRPENYLKATKDYLNQKIIFNHKLNKLNKLCAGENVKIAKNVKILGPVFIGSNSTIDEGCKLTNGTVIGENVNIEKNCRIQNSVVMRYCHIKENSNLNGAIIDTNSLIDKNVTIQKGVIIGHHSKVQENSIVKTSSKP